MPELHEFKPNEYPNSVVIATKKRDMVREDFDRGHVHTGFAKQVSGVNNTEVFIQSIRGVGGRPCVVCGKPECPYELSFTSNIKWMFDAGGHPMCMVQEREQLKPEPKASNLDVPQYLKISKEDSESYLQALAEKADALKPISTNDRVTKLEGMVDKILGIVEGIAGNMTVFKEIEPEKEAAPKEESMEPVTVSAEEIDAAIPAYEPQMSQEDYDKAHNARETDEAAPVASKQRGWPKGKKRVKKG